jgi:hypothetical protein
LHIDIATSRITDQLANLFVIINTPSTHLTVKEKTMGIPRAALVAIGQCIGTPTMVPNLHEWGEKTLRTAMGKSRANARIGLEATYQALARVNDNLADIIAFKKNQ